MSRDMRSRRLHLAGAALLAAASVVVTSPPAPAQDTAAESAPPPLGWIPGPTELALGDQAVVAVPEGWVALDAGETRRYMEMLGNPVSGIELGTLAPASNEESWFIVFEFRDIGYVKDDDKDALDPDAILEAIRRGTEAGNEERRKRGWSELDVIGWEVEPHYDEATHNLEWAVRLESEGQPVLNHNTRILGRRGVMEVALVCNPDELESVLPRARAALAGFHYTPENDYAAFREGDKVAQIGLAALVAGGAAVAAVKFGLFKKFGKLIVAGIVAVGAAIAGWFRKIFGRGAGAASETASGS